MQILNSLENSFVQSSLKVKLELFLFPLLLLVLVFFLFYENKNNTKNTTLNANTVSIAKPNKKAGLKIIKDFETYIFEKRIKLLNISSLNNQIQIHISSDIVKILQFLVFVESYNDYSKIETIKIEDNELQISISFEKLYLKKQNKKQQLEQKNMQHFLQEYGVIKDKFSLNAIIGNTVLINDKWYFVGDTILENFRLIEIKKHSVLVKSESIILKIGLYDDDNL